MPGPEIAFSSLVISRLSGGPNKLQQTQLILRLSFPKDALC